MSVTNFYIICVISPLVCLAMLCILWLAVEKTRVLLTGAAETPFQTEKESQNIEVKPKIFSKIQHESSSQDLVLKNVNGLDAVLSNYPDLKYLTNYDFRHNPQYKAQLSQNLTDIKEINSLDFSSVKPITKAGTLILRENKTIILHLNGKLPSIQVIEDHSLTYVNQIRCYGNQMLSKMPCTSLVTYEPKITHDKKCYSTTLKIVKRDQLSKLQKIAKLLTEYFNHNSKSRLGSVEFSKSKLLKNSCMTETDNDDYKSETLFTYKVQRNELLTSFSITEIDLLGNIEISNNQGKAELSDELHKRSKYTKTKRNHKEKSSGRVTKQHVGLSVDYGSMNSPSYSHSKLVAEIERQLKPIKDQIEELRQSMSGFMTNSDYKSKRARSKVWSLKPINLTNKSKSTAIYPSSLSKLSNISSNEICLLTPSCPQKYHLKKEPKHLSPLAEMYIKLSKF